MMQGEEDQKESLSMENSCRFTPQTFQSTGKTKVTGRAIDIVCKKCPGLTDHLP